MVPKPDIPVSERLECYLLFFKCLEYLFIHRGLTYDSTSQFLLF